MIHKAKTMYWNLRTLVWLRLVRPLVRLSRSPHKLKWLFSRSNDLEFTIAGQPVFLRGGTSDADVFEEVFLDEEYGADVPFPVSTIVDCGANVGLTARYFLHRFPGAKVVSIEPDPGNHAAAKRNLTPYSDRCSLLLAAVWPSAGEVAVKRGQFADRRDWATQVSDDVQIGDTVVPAMTIDDVMAEANMQAIDILKIDIEGAELDLFRGDMGFLRHVRCLMVELHDSECEAAFMDAIRPLGFSVSRHGMTTVAFAPSGK